MIFGEIRFKNFLSSGNVFQKIPLNKHQRLLITGKNGSGKTLIEQAIKFALFGKTDRGLTKNQFVNSTNNKDCMVELDFTKGSDVYCVRRGIKPNLFEITKNGTTMPLTGVLDQQKHFEEEILRSNQRIVNQIVSLGTTSYVPFLQLPAQHRREVVEKLLDIEVLSDITKNLKSKMSVWDSAWEKVKREIEVLEIKIDGQKNLIDKIQKQSTEAKEELKTSLKEIMGVLSAKKFERQLVANEREKITAKLDNEPFNQQGRLVQQLTKLTFEKNAQTKRINFFSDHDHCDSCEQTLTDGHKRLMVKDATTKIDLIETELEGYKEQEKPILEAISEQEKLEKEEQVANQRLRTFDTEIKNLVDQGTVVANKIKAMNATNSLEEESAKYNQWLGELSVLTKQKDEMRDEREVLAASVQLFKDNGVKGQILKTYIPFINKQMNHYLDALSFNVRFSLNENFEEKILSKGRDDFTYHSFSMGQRQRVDLAMMFTWRDIAARKNSLRTNLLFFDEVLDSSMDDLGVNDLFAILEADTKTNLIVISHKGEQFAEHFDAQLNVSMVKGFSQYNFVE